MICLKEVISVALDKIEVFDSLAKDALEKFGIESYKAEPLQISENITYLVKNEETGQKKVLRICRPGYHTFDEINAELLWLAEIKNYTPVIVAEPVIGTNGSYVQLLESWMIGNTYAGVMYEFLEGSAPDENDEENVIKMFVKLGEITAYLHKQSKMWNKAKDLSRFSWNYETMLGSAAPWGKWSDTPDLTPETLALLSKTSDIIKKRLTDYGQSNERYGLIHADLRLANLLIEGDQVKVIDFDDCGFGWYMHDLAAALSFIETCPIADKLVESWLHGYLKVDKLSDDDIAEIDTFIMQRRLQLLAWITSHFDSDPVKKLSVGYTEGTVALAQKYLTKFN